MIKRIYILGIISSNLLLLGGIFKILHYPGAGLLLLFSIIIFCFLFLPFAMINAYKHFSKKQKLGLYIVSFIVCVINLIAALFKMQHYPGASWLMMLAIPLPFILFLPVYLYNSRKEKQSSSNHIYIMLFLTFYSVFSVVLAMNVSKYLLDAFAVTEIHTSEISQYFKTKKEILNKPLNKNALVVSNISNELCKSIENLKIKLIEETEGKNSPAFSGDSILTMQIQQKESLHPISKILLGNNNDGEAKILKNKIVEYKNSLLEIIGSKDENRSNFISNILATEKVENDNRMFEWETWHFEYATLIISVEVLTELQSKVKMAESEMLEFL